MGAFGEKLRTQREHRGITLEAIANTTKISTRMLKALEDEHFDQLPGGVFNKGFVRAYARLVGLNEQEAINDYLVALAESQVHSQPIIPNFRNTPAIPARPTFDNKPDNKFENKLANKSSAADILAGRNNAEAADRRSHPDRRVEARRTLDRLTEVVKTGDQLFQDRPPARPNDARPIEDRPIEDRPTEDRPKEDHIAEDRKKDDRKKPDGEDSNRPKPAFVAESPEMAGDRAVDGLGDHADRSVRAKGADAPSAPPKHPLENFKDYFELHFKERFRDRAKDRSKDGPQEISYDDLPAAPPSFLNLSEPPTLYEEPQNDEPENEQPENHEPEVLQGANKEPLEPAPAPAPVIRRRPSQPIRWRSLAIPLLLVVIVILFVVFLRRNRPGSQQAAVSQPAAPAEATPTSTAPTPPRAAANPVEPAKVSAQNGSNASSSSNAVPSIPSSSSPHNSSEKPAPAETSSDVTKIIPPRAQPSKPKPLPPFTLIIRASENSSVAITADGQPVAQENLIAPAATSVRATKEILVKASNAAGVSFMFNGKDIPAAGAEGQPHTYIFDANGLRNSTPASTQTSTN